MNVFNVNLKKIVDESYEINIGCELMPKLIGDIKAGLVGDIKKFVIVTDSIVKELYAMKIYNLLIDNGYSCDIISFLSGEKSKTRKTKEFIEDIMLEKGYRRDCCIIAVGGGVVTDIAGFVAGTFARGIPYINYPTTLLAAADASIGGKTAVDTDLATNLIGIFNQPRKVYIDIATWRTLPERQLSSGLSETIKHSCIASQPFFDYLNTNMDAIFGIDIDVCQNIARENCRIKYQVVTKDEKESGLREILNLGHTVGRAIETVSDYSLLHGEALSIGLVAEIKLAKKLGYCTDADELMMTSILKKAKLPVNIPEYIDREKLVKKLYTDKKVKNGKLRFVLQDGIGNIKSFENDQYALEISESQIREILIDM